MAIAKQLPAPSILEDATSKLSNDTTSSWKRYHCKLVTPMFGGGVTAGEVDKDMPIRATAIRGQLRFWWRLLNQTNNPTNTEEMFKKERAIWGGLGDKNSLAASKVCVHVSNVTNIQPVDCATYEMGQNNRYQPRPNVNALCQPYLYALFPFLGQLSPDKTNIVKHPATFIKEGLEWDLNVSFKDLNDEQINSVVESIRWWASFGGVGARTRRGLGAVEVFHVESANDKTLLMVTAEMVNAKPGFILTNGNENKSALRAWTDALGTLRDFRQGIDMGRNRGEQNNRPGRSRWPEPAAIRSLTGQHRIKENPQISFLPAPDTPSIFPRAAFGLPIIFHFQGANGDIQSDPKDTELKPYLSGKEKDRMASPLIIRPYRVVGTGSNVWRAAVLKLPDDHVWKMQVKLKYVANAANQRMPATIENWWPKVSTEKESAANAIRPMQYRPTDPISAFLQYFRAPHPANPPQAQNDNSNLPPKTEWEKAKITFNRNNGTVIATKDEMSATALGESGRSIWSTLTPDAQRKIQSGFYRATAVVQGNTLIKVKETP